MFTRGVRAGSHTDQQAVDDDFADPEGAAAVLSGVMSMLSGGANLLSSGVNRLSGSGTGPQSDANAAAIAVDGGGDIDPLLGQPILRRVVGAGSLDMSQDERAASEAEERVKSAAYAEVEVKSKAHAQL